MDCICLMYSKSYTSVKRTKLSCPIYMYITSLSKDTTKFSATNLSSFTLRFSCCLLPCLVLC